MKDATLKALRDCSRIQDAAERERHFLHQFLPSAAPRIAASLELHLNFCSLAAASDASLSGDGKLVEPAAAKLPHPEDAEQIVLHLLPAVIADMRDTAAQTKIREVSQQRSELNLGRVIRFETFCAAVCQQTARWWYSIPRRAPATLLTASAAVNGSKPVQANQAVKDVPRLETIAGLDESSLAVLRRKIVAWVQQKWGVDKAEGESLFYFAVLKSGRAARKRNEPVNLKAPYLRKIVHRLCIYKLKQRNFDNLTKNGEMLDPADDRSPDPASTAEANEMRAILRRLIHGELKRLPLASCEVLVARYVDGFEKNQWIAQKLAFLDVRTTEHKRLSNKDVWDVCDRAEKRIKASKALNNAIRRIWNTD